ncbi:hypothetical protein HDU67_000109 [Dinochytrium kinnereticum]|nr:hypothetical protein HDU67_000109 [Dinochytrium kinnereticum]
MGKNDVLKESKAHAKVAKARVPSGKKGKKFVNEETMHKILGAINDVQDEQIVEKLKKRDSLKVLAVTKQKKQQEKKSAKKDVLEQKKKEILALSKEKKKKISPAVLKEALAPSTAQKNPKKSVKFQK